MILSNDVKGLGYTNNPIQKGGGGGLSKKETNFFNSSCMFLSLKATIALMFSGKPLKATMALNSFEHP